MKKKIRILLIEDVADDVVRIEHELRSGGLAFSATHVATREKFLHELKRRPPDIILFDHGLPEFDGCTAVSLAREHCPDIPFIFVTGSAGEEPAINSLRDGTIDTVLKSRLSSLVPTVQRALILAHGRRQRKQPESDLRKHPEDEIRRLNTELEARVQERTAELQAAYREMEAFSYSISHDLRAPLIHIAGFVDMLKNDLGSKLDEKSSRHLQTICDSTEKMGRMITDLLTFSRIGRAELHKVRFNVGDTVREVRRDLQAQLQGRNINWKTPELPDVFGDPFLLRQAIFILLSNAIKYTRNRAETRIELSVETTATEHIFAVSDNGAGFDMKYYSKLFGVFQRLHSASEFEGTGIGLANARRIIQRHAGRTWAEGVVDEGATFYFTLPVITEDP